MLKRTKVIVVEGADKVGKSHFIERFLLRNKFAQEVKYEQKHFRTNAADKRRTISYIKSLPKGKIYLLDRFILTDLVYDEVLKRKDFDQYALNEVLWEFCRDEELEVWFVILDGVLRITEFVDDKIRLSAKQYNSIVRRYRQFQDDRALQGYLIFKKIVTNGRLNLTQEAALLRVLKKICL